MNHQHQLAGGGHPQRADHHPAAGLSRDRAVISASSVSVSTVLRQVRASLNRRRAP
ncbi:putative linear gramicidin synthetase subunit D [Mycobacterium xenopi 4042]|uniref:Putative linear gramicidin synthetase subunit D n=1 Tax=Mycobacterium xenopi 4042 TaxID=1299334 RepID=X8E8I9_MYCXE|nr:putative linear gramicidin synthetase subunit D [Mycobacterium xenopi 4042]